MESALPQAWPRPPYVPLVVGVTGHRNILASARPEIWVRVRDVLLELLADRGRRRLIVMSGLAEGADRLVASVAFDLKEQARYRDVIDVVACLPLTPDEYERDFETEASKASFREMLGRCVHSIVVSDETGVTDRPECYRLQGRLLTRYAQVLVALWDGDEGRGRGGTAEVVQMMLGRPPADMYAPLADPIGAGRVTQIVTPRDDRPRPERAFERVDSWIAEGPESDAVRATRQEAARECFETIDASVLRLNERIAVEHAAGDVRARVSKTYLLGEGEEVTWAPLDHLVRAYAYADGLAIPDKARWERAHFRLMTLVAAFLSMFVVYSDFLGYPVFLMAHALLAATALGYWGTVKDQKRSHLDMRALAEGLRVQIVWSLAGVRALVADEYLGVRSGELDWIRSAIRSYELESRWACAPAAPANEVLPNARVVTEQWIGSQADFYTDRIERKAAKVRQTKSILRTLRWAAVLMTLGLVVATLWPVLMERASFFRWAGEPFPVSTTSWWMLFASLAFISWAVLEKYVEVEAYEQEARQYVRMSTLFREARDRVTALEQLDEADDVRRRAYHALLRDAGREALQENQDWLLLHRDRKLKPYA